MEQMEILEKELYLRQFWREKPIAQVMAKIALKELVSSTFSFAQAPIHIACVPATSATTNATINTAICSNNSIQVNSVKSDMVKGLGFTYDLSKTVVQKKQERKERIGKKRLEEEFGLMDV